MSTQAKETPAIAITVTDFPVHRRAGFQLTLDQQIRDATSELRNSQGVDLAASGESLDASDPDPGDAIVSASPPPEALPTSTEVPAQRKSSAAERPAFTKDELNDDSDIETPRAKECASFASAAAAEVPVEATHILSPPAYAGDPLALSDVEVSKLMEAEEKDDLKQIKYGPSLEEIDSGNWRALIRHFEIHPHPAESIDSFLNTYHYYVDSISFLKTLILHFRVPSTSGTGSSPDMTPENRTLLGVYTQVRIIALIKRWIELRWNEVHRVEAWAALLRRFIDWLADSSVPKFQDWAKNLRTTKTTARDLNKACRDSLARLSRTLTPADQEGFDLFERVIDIPAKDLARQLTLLEQRAAANIPLAELSNTQFSKPGKSPHFTRHSTRCNEVGKLVVSMVLAAKGMDKTPKSRAKIICHLLAVINELLALNNFCTAMQVHLALETTPITRLWETAKHLKTKPKAVEHCERFKAFFAPASNFKAFRQAEESATAPCILFPAILSKDLTFMEENATSIPNGWVNYSKMVLLGKIFNHFMRTRDRIYEFPVNVRILHFLHAHTVLEEADQYINSRKLEAPENLADKPQGHERLASTAKSLVKSLSNSLIRRPPKGH